MNTATFIDLYCERTSASWWNEPLNVVTNLAFFVAAYLLACQLRSMKPNTGLGVPWDWWALSGLIALIGMGSLLFHLFAQPWAGWLDVMFIAFYLHFFIAVYLRHIFRWPWRWAWLGIVFFFLFAQMVTQVMEQWPLPWLRGTTQYQPALLGLCLLALLSFAYQRATAIWLWIAVLTFAISLLFRQIDLPLCQQWRYGTHFIWHILNAVVLWMTARAIIQNDQATTQ
jgi:hypothetical protein